MNEFIQVFIDFIPNDKKFINDSIPKYEREFITLGEFIRKHSDVLWCKNNSFMEELLDFLDGNGFEVVRPDPYTPSFSMHPVKLIPLYSDILKTEEVEINVQEEIQEANERLKAAIEKIQSALTQYSSVQETVLHDTSMDSCERYILEYQELLASWAFWLRVCRRMELLRLVPDGRCGSAAVPRPP